MAKIYKQITDLIGKTPLVELGKYSASKGLETPVIAKVEFFNPFSLVKALNARKIAPYWFGSGTPSFLLKLLDKYHVNLASLESQEVVLNSFDLSTE